MNELIKILVIDDSEDDRLLYRRALEKSINARYIISEAYEGEEGLRCIQEDQPACILLDYSLPGRNGIEVLGHIRSKHPFIPVVMLTGQGNESVAVAAMQHGAQNYISKSSITAETLEHVIRMAVEHCMMQKRIHEQRTSLEVFTRALAHDLNEPVRTIRTFIELIAQFDSFPEKTKTYFQYIQNAADRMHMLIDTVFFYTKLDSPEQIAKETCDMGTVLREAEENLTQLIHEHGAIITCNSPLPEVYVNHMQLMQVLQNLISNAIHHSDKAVTIQVSASTQADHWLFSVRDNGPGIEEAYLQKIFDPFKRLKHHEIQGAGLGLATCKKIVEAHGGKIWCESRSGAGATFLFTLPKALPQSTETHQPVPQTPVNVSTPNDSKQLANVLLVDDSRAFIEITQIELKERSRLQCNFFVARNGEEALDRLYDKMQENKPIDLVLLDINMPEMDGFELLERMRADKALQQVSVVMYTGSIYDKDMERAKELGAIGYLTKPIDFTKLKSAIERTAAVKLCQEGNGYTLLRAA